MMKAAVYYQYGPPDVVEIKEIPKPIPGPNDVLIKVHATTVTAGDWRVRSLDLPPGFGWMGRLVFGLFGPRQPILGTELSGVIENVGKNATKFKVGDQVFAFNGAKMGCHAEYKCLHEKGAIALKPSNLTHEQAAALSFGGATALDFLRRAQIKHGDKVLINGASGGVGTAAVQLAKHFGAEVTGVCSASNTELVRSLGASHVIDYTTQDFTQNGEKYDIIVDTAGTSPYSRCAASLRDDGRLCLVLAGLWDTLSSLWMPLFTRKRVIAGPAAESAEALEYLATLAKKGEYMPSIDRELPLQQIVLAHRLVDSKRKRGNVVITMS